jgi:hypothetical protein
MGSALDGKFYGVIHRHKDNQIEPPDSWIVFVACDNALLPTLNFYYGECKRLGAEMPQLSAVAELINRVEKWRYDHPEQLKTPDVTPGELAW